MDFRRCLFARTVSQFRSQDKAQPVEFFYRNFQNNTFDRLTRLITSKTHFRGKSTLAIFALYIHLFNTRDIR